MSKIANHLLPEALRDLVRALGEATAYRLVEKRGGARVVVPKRVSPDHPLADLLGFKGFADLVEHFGSMVLDLPKYDAVTRQLRHQRVRKLRGEGKTMDRVAVATGYTRRHVINILADDAELAASAQLDMFETPADEAPGRASDPAANAPAVSANDPFGLARRGS